MFKLFLESIASVFRTPPSEHWQMLKQDTRYALRMMGKNLGFTSIAVVTLALGVGVNTAIFSVVHGIMLRPLPYKQGDQIVLVREQLQKAGVKDLLFSVQEISDYRQQNNTMSGLVEYHGMRFTLLDNGSAERVRTGVVSYNYFDFFGVKPILGRSFTAAEEQPGAPAALLLSYEYWQQRQNGDPNIVGKTFRMNDRVHTVIGVLPPVPQYPIENDVYMTTSSCPFRSAPAFINNRSRRLMNVFGRLKPGVTLQQANSDLGVIANRLAQENPGIYAPDAGYRAIALSLQGELTRDARTTLWVLLGAAGFVLLIACANVANFTLARMSQREQELTLRAALGANRRRLFRQLFTESVLVGLFAAGLGVLLAIASHKLLVEFVSRLTPRAREISIDVWVLLFALIAAVLTSVITGSVLAFSSRDQMGSGLKDAARSATAGAGQRQIRSVLIVAQVAFSLALLVGAGLLLRSFLKLQSVDPGFAAEKVLTMAIDLNWTKYVNQQDQRNAGRAILEKVQSLPGVISAAVSSSFPLDPDARASGVAGFNSTYQVEGRMTSPGEVPPVGGSRSASPDYFKTLGIPLLQGRPFAVTDKSDSPAVALVNLAFADHRLKGENPIGKRISTNGGKTWISIVGVVGNTKEFGLSETVGDEVYFPLEQSPAVGSLILRTAGDPMAMASRVRSAVNEAAPETAITFLVSLEDARNDTLSVPRVMTSLLALFACLALIVAASGIGGILALSVSQRLKEIGIRLALGAQPSDVRTMVVNQGMVLVGLGLACGLIVTAVIAVAGPLKGYLFQVGFSDPVTLVGVCALLAVVALIACYIPARRATKINPIIALRHE